ncbi:Pentatricopeptide repeat-containing protein At4g19191, mitochondrial [Linum grandiflorum]
MMKEYNINAGVDHYSCIVDLLGHAGKLKEALDFAVNIFVKPDGAIWSALLCYCKNIYNNVKIAQYAASRLLGLETPVTIPYGQMANIYASTGRLDKFARIRNRMKHNRLKTSPGKSSVEVNGKPVSHWGRQRCRWEAICFGLVLAGCYFVHGVDIINTRNMSAPCCKFILK